MLSRCDGKTTEKQWHQTTYYMTISAFSWHSITWKNDSPAMDQQLRTQIANTHRLGVKVQDLSAITIHLRHVLAKRCRPARSDIHAKCMCMKLVVMYAEDLCTVVTFLCIQTHVCRCTRGECISPTLNSVDACWYTTVCALIPSLARINGWIYFAMTVYYMSTFSKSSKAPYHSLSL